MEGLFRVPGPAQHIEDLRKDFEEGTAINENNDMNLFVI